MDQMQTVPGPSQAAFTALNNQIVTLNTMFKIEGDAYAGDMDNLGTGLYYVRNATNTPSGGTTSYFVISMKSGAHAAQIACRRDTSTPAMHYRHCNNGTWSAWKTITMS